MKPASLILIATLTAIASPAADANEYERRLREQERQIKQLETENSRLRWLLQRNDQPTIGDPLYGVSGQGAKQDRIHIVRKGDSLDEIARKNGTTPEILAAHNKLPNEHLIHTDQPLRIPSAPPSPEIDERPAAMAKLHTVRAGENLYRIALKHGMELDRLLAQNPGIDPLKLRIGQQVRVSDSPARNQVESRHGDAPDPSIPRNPVPSERNPEHTLQGNHLAIQAPR